MAQHCQQQNILLIIVLPDSNLLFPPARSSYEGPPARRDEALGKFKSAIASRYLRGDPAQAERLLREVADFCSFADLHFELGTIRYEQGRYAEAEQWLRRARSCDGFPMCITQPYRDILSELATQYSCPAIDVRPLVLRPPAPLARLPLFWDDCHLHKEVYEELGRQIVATLVQHDLLAARSQPPPLEATDWHRMGITPVVQQLAVMWEVRYHIHHAGMFFLRLRFFEQARQYVDRIQTQPIDDVSTAELRTGLDQAIAQEKARLARWIETSPSGFE